MSLPPHTTEMRERPNALSGIDRAIDVRDVTVAYPTGQVALDTVTFALAPASIVALVGVNGSGKSTLFKSLMGFLQPRAGAIAIAGLPVREALKRGLVAYVPQAEDVDWNFPVLVEDVVMMGRYGHMGFLRIAGTQDKRAVREALERVGMMEYRFRQIGELSGGQRKRVFLARSLAQNADIILLDEPFTGVDVKSESAIVALMRDMRSEGRLLFVSTHNLGSVPDFCDHVVLINRTIVASGPTEMTFTQANLAKAFGGVLRHIQLGGGALHTDEDERSVTVITDDERALVLYGETGEQRLVAPDRNPARNAKS
jgi:manganese/iron transport system ATP-binding protein